MMYSLDLCPNESLTEVIRQDYESKRISSEWSTIQDLDWAITLGPESALKKLAKHKHGFITDVFKSLAWWGWFQGSAPNRNRVAPAGMGASFGFVDPNKSNTKRKKKRQTQKQARKQNRSKKKR